MKETFNSYFAVSKYACLQKIYILQVDPYKIEFAILNLAVTGRSLFQGLIFMIYVRDPLRNLLPLQRTIDSLFLGVANTMETG